MINIKANLGGRYETETRKGENIKNVTFSNNSKNLFCNSLLVCQITYLSNLRKVCNYWQQNWISSNSVTFSPLNRKTKVHLSTIGRHGTWQDTASLRGRSEGLKFDIETCHKDCVCVFHVRRKADWMIRRLWMCISSAWENCCWPWQVNGLLSFPYRVWTKAKEGTFPVDNNFNFWATFIFYN